MRSSHGAALLISLGWLPIATEDGATGSQGGATEAPTSTSGTSGTSEGASEFSPTNKFETDTSPPPPTEPACVAYYQLHLMCSGEGTNYAAYWAGFCDHYIATGLALDGPMCAEAVAAWYVCLSELPCVLFNGHTPQCVAEGEAFAATCPQLFPEPP
jgi:hypothetical protein